MGGDVFSEVAIDLEGLRFEFEGEVGDGLGEVVVKHEGGDGYEETGCGGDEGFGDAGGDDAGSAHALGADVGEGADDAFAGSEETDEGGDGGDGGEDGEVLFEAGEFAAQGEGHDALGVFAFGISSGGDLGEDHGGEGRFAGLAFGEGGGVIAGEEGLIDGVSEVEGGGAYFFEEGEAFEDDADAEDGHDDEGGHGEAAGEDPVEEHRMLSVRG